MSENLENQEACRVARSEGTSEASPVSLEELLELLRRSKDLSRKAAADGRSLGVLSESDLRIRVR